MTNRDFESRAGPFGPDVLPLAVAVRSEDSSWVIEVQGELDLATAPLLQQHLRTIAEPAGNGGPRRVVYVLPELEFMDCTGLQSLLTAVDGHGPETIAVREPSRQVRRLLELAGWDSLIEEPANR